MPFNDREIIMKAKTILMLTRWFVPFSIAVHNIEEAFTLDPFLPVIKERLSKYRGNDFVPTWPQYRLALITVTLIPFVVAILPLKAARRLTLMLIASTTMLINVIPHLAGSIIFKQYVPGLASSLLINLPSSMLSIFLAFRSGFLNLRKMAVISIFAAILHGPGLASLLAASGFLTGKIRQEE
jgi:hypothetical protein